MDFEFGMIETLKNNWFLEVVIVLIFIILIKIKTRGYFWKAKDGSHLSFKDFRKRFWKGVEGITPVQQTRTILISLLPIFAGTIWGVVITFLGKVWWASLMLTASIPIQCIQFISNYQKYKAQKRVEDTIKSFKITKNAN